MSCHADGRVYSSARGLGHVHLETTTIYVRVAKPTDGQGVTSPLDVMTRKQAARAPSVRAKTSRVGKLRI